MAVDLNSMRAPLCFSLISLISSFASATASAGGFYITDIGARGMARAGALVASPDDLLAIHYNPAGLSLLKGVHFQGDMQIVDYRVKFERSCPCLPDGAANKDELEAGLEQSFAEHPSESSTPLFIPFIGLAYGLDFLDITIALALWGPTSGRHNYGDLPPASGPTFPGRAIEQPGRYSGLEAKNLEANIGLGIALSPFKGFRIGFTALVFQNGTEQTLHLWANLESLVAGPEDANFDVPIVFDFRETFALNWLLGASYDIPFLDGLSIGGSFRGKRDIRTNGTISVVLPSKLADVASVSGDEVTVELSTAPLARGGIQFKLPKVFTAEAAFVWEGWSVHDDIVIRPQNIEFRVATSPEPITLGQLVSSRRWRNTWSVRLGGEVDLMEPFLGIRAGYFYEPSAIPLERLDASRVDLDKHGVGLGLSTEWYGFKLEVSAMFIALKTGTVTNSVTQLTSPIKELGNPDYENFIANGTYSGRYFIFGASLQFALDSLLESI